METLLALTIGVLVASSVYLMLARNVLRFLFGLILLSNAANLTIFLAGRLTPRLPPLIAEGALEAAPGVANPLPQALVLTAIVIGFGLFAFALMLVFRAYQAMGTLDGDRMRLAEPEGGAPLEPGPAPVEPGSQDAPPAVAGQGVGQPPGHAPDQPPGHVSGEASGDASGGAAGPGGRLPEPAGERRR